MFYIEINKDDVDDYLLSWMLRFFFFCVINYGGNNVRIMFFCFEFLFFLEEEFVNLF